MLNIYGFLISIFLLPYYVAPQESAVYEYGSDNFYQQIEDMDDHFIMFYAPWCRHCTEFYPIWSELAELINSKGSKHGIAQVDCTKHVEICQEKHITGYPTLLYINRLSFSHVEYKGTRDLPSLTEFLSEQFTKNSDLKEAMRIKMFNGLVYLNDDIIESKLALGQHFVMFYAPWCKASQRLGPIWSKLTEHYRFNGYLQLSKMNCLKYEMSCKNFDIKYFPYLVWIVNGKIMGTTDASTLDELIDYVEKMLQSENHDPTNFVKKKKTLPVARISEETFEHFLENELVFVNYFASWCGHCMQLSPLWVRLGVKFQNESRVLIADVDCANSKNICETEKINGLPTLILYKNKKIVNIENGGRTYDDLITIVYEHLEGDKNEGEKEENVANEQALTAKDEL